MAKFLESQRITKSHGILENIVKTSNCLFSHQPARPVNHHLYLPEVEGEHWDTFLEQMDQPNQRYTILLYLLHIIAHYVYIIYIIHTSYKPVSSNHSTSFGNVSPGRRAWNRNFGCSLLMWDSCWRAAFAAHSCGQYGCTGQFRVSKCCIRIMIS